MKSRNHVLWETMEESVTVVLEPKAGWPMEEGRAPSCQCRRKIYFSWTLELPSDGVGHLVKWWGLHVSRVGGQSPRTRAADGSLITASKASSSEHLWSQHGAPHLCWLTSEGRMEPILSKDKISAGVGLILWNFWKAGWPKLSIITRSLLSGPCSHIYSSSVPLPALTSLWWETLWG